MSIEFIYTGIYSIETIRLLDYVIHMTPDIFVHSNNIVVTDLDTNRVHHWAPLFQLNFLESEFDDFSESLIEKSAGCLELYKGKRHFSILQYFGFSSSGEAYLKILTNYKFFWPDKVDNRILRGPITDYNSKIFKKLFIDYIEAFLSIRNLKEIYDNSSEFLNKKKMIENILKWLKNEPLPKDVVDSIVGTPLNSFESELMKTYIDDYQKAFHSFALNKNEQKDVQKKITALLSRRY